MQSCSTFFDNPKSYLFRLPLDLKKRVALFATHNSSIKQKILFHAPLFIKSSIYICKNRLDYMYQVYHENSEIKEPHDRCSQSIGKEQVSLFASGHCELGPNGRGVRPTLNITIKESLQGDFLDAHLIKNGKEILVQGTEGNTYFDATTKKIIKQTVGHSALNQDLTKSVCCGRKNKNEIVINDTVNEEPICCVNYCYKQLNEDNYAGKLKSPRFNADGTKIVLEFEPHSYLSIHYRATSFECFDISQLLELEKKINTLEPIDLLILQSIYNKIQPKVTRKYLKSRTKAFDEKLKTSLISASFLAMRRKLRANLP